MSGFRLRDHIVKVEINLHIDSLAAPRPKIQSTGKGVDAGGSRLLLNFGNLHFFLLLLLLLLLVFLGDLVLLLLLLLELHLNDLLLRGLLRLLLTLQQWHVRLVQVVLGAALGVCHPACSLWYARRSLTPH